MHFRAFAGAASLVRAAPIERALSNIAHSTRRLPFRPSPLVTSQRYTSHVTIEQLAPPPGQKERRRVGRGIGSRRGGHTSGRGHKGAKARGSGNPYRGFEGGQTPLIKKIPKRGFKNATRKEYKTLSIARIQEWISKGKYDPSEPLTINKVISTKMIKHLSTKFNGIKLVMPMVHSLPFPPLTLHLSRFSEAAGEAVTNRGGTCLAVYHNKLGLWQEVHPDKFEGDRRVKNAGPTKRRDIEYYMNPAKYGYLSTAAAKEAFFRERGWDPETRRSRYGGAIRTDIVPGSLPPKNPFPKGSILSELQ